MDYKIAKSKTIAVSDNRHACNQEGNMIKTALNENKTNARETSELKVNKIVISHRPLGLS